MGYIDYIGYIGYIFLPFQLHAFVGASEAMQRGGSVAHRGSRPASRQPSFASSEPGDGTADPSHASRVSAGRFSANGCGGGGVVIGMEASGPELGLHEAEEMNEAIEDDIRPEDSISVVANNASPAPPPAGVAGRGGGRPRFQPQLQTHAEGARGGAYLVKLHDVYGCIHRLKAEPNCGWAALRDRLQEALGASHPPLTAVTYTDDDGDQVTSPS